jgi:hypothetical protein
VAAPQTDASTYAPRSVTIDAQVDNAAAGADEIVTIVAPMTGKVTAASITPTAAITGANTESRNVVVTNKGQSGAGSTIVAEKDFTSGVNAPADDETAVTLSGTAANLLVVAGDVLEIKSLHVGATGLAAPDLTARITIAAASEEDWTGYDGTRITQP